MTDANLKITIITKDNNLVDFLVQAELDMDIFTEKPIDENSEFNDGECFNLRKALDIKP